jgi:MFS transporter, SP family, galactose:H+ symporter
MKKIPIGVVLFGTLGGFLFGYNTSIIAGALPFLKQSFNLSAFREGFIVSIALIGALLGSLIAGNLADRFGRKMATLMTAVVFIVGIWVTAQARSIDELLIGRFITGAGVGLSSVLAPLYLSEMSPTEFRGAIVSGNQFAIAIGILVAYAINYAFAAQGAWRYMFGLGMIPAIIQFFGFLALPETEQWKLSRGKKEKKKSWKSFLEPKPRYLLAVGVILSAFQQITGVNAVIYFAPQIFLFAGFSKVTVSILATMGLGVINVLATLLSVWLMDRAGRRKLLLIGLVGMVVSLVILATAFITSMKAIDQIAIISLLGYIAFFAIGLGPVTWVILAEIYPLEIRGRAMAIACFVNWMCNTLVSLTFLDLVISLGTGGTFFLYAAFGVVGWWFVFRYIPETKGKSFEQIQKTIGKV